MKKKVVIVDYGLGNIQSAINSVKKALSSENSNNNIVEKTSDYKFIKDASHIILPGQGAFESCIKGLQKLDGMIDELQNQVLVKKKPIFGICVGMQLFATKSFENGEHNGLNWIKGNIIKIQSKKNVLPHMGWNKLNNIKQHAILSGVENEHFYFVHSYYFMPQKEENILAYTDYDTNFPSIVNEKNIFGTQFHPEKSSKAGIKLLSNFLLLN